MTSFARLTLIASLILFAIFFTNVGFGAAGQSEFLGDVPQMLLLLASVFLFVVGILRCEARSKEQNEADRT